MPNAPAPRPPGIRPPGIDAWTEAQRTAVAAEAPAVVVRGGFFSGKTSVLAARAARRAMQTDAPVWLLAGTGHGAQHLQSVLRAMDAGGVQVTTLPRLAARLLRSGADDGQDWTLTTASESRRRIARILEAMGYKDLSDAPHDVWREVMARAARGETSDDGPDDLPPSFPLDAEAMEEVVTTYRMRLRETRTLDEPHLLQRAAACSASLPDAGSILIDDAQNLSPVGVALLGSLKPVTVSIALHPAACVTAGRGGEPGAVRSLAEDVAERSGTQVFSADLPSSPAHASAPAAWASEWAATWATGRSTMSSGADADAEQDASGREEGVTAFVADAGQTERERTAAAIANNGPPGEIAVLMPDDAQVDAMASACADHDLPVHVPAQPWHDAETLQDVLAYLFVIANPHDDIHLFRVINTPSRGIGRTTQARLRSYATERGLSAWGAIAAADEEKALTSRARRVLRGFRERMEPLIERSGEATPAALARALVADTELLTSVTRGQTREQIEREERVEQFIRRMPRAGGRAALLGFLDDAALGHVCSGAETCVVVATPETALGMHRPVVFIGGLNEGWWPAEYTVRSDALLENERRRLAVAVARAQGRAILSRARSRGTGRRTEPAARSRFWEEIEQQRGELPAADLGRDAPRGDGRDYRTSLRARQSDATAAPRPTDDEAAAIRPGQRVEHPKLGRGTVRDVEDDGTTRVAEVDFDERGTKRLNLKYAPLTEI